MNEMQKLQQDLAEIKAHFEAQKAFFLLSNIAFDLEVERESSNYQVDEEALNDYADYLASTYTGINAF